MRQPSLFERRFRIVTGLTLATYVTLHFINHSLGLISMEAMEAMRKVITPFWRSWYGASLLYGSLIFHFLMGLLSIYRRRTLKIPAWELSQFTFGLLLIPFLAGHIAATFGTRYFFGADLTYTTVLTYMFSNNWYVWRQLLLLIIVVTHVCIGIHFFLRLKETYRKLFLVIYPLALLLPILTVLSIGRVSADLGLWDKTKDNKGGYEYSETSSPSSKGAKTQEVEKQPKSSDGLEYFGTDYSNYQETTGNEYSGYGASNGLTWAEKVKNRDLFQYSILAAFWGLFAFMLLARLARRLFRSKNTIWHLRHSNGRNIPAQKGQTILEALRMCSVPHASVCGGRGRCTTCRVRIESASAKALHAPSSLEQSALDRIKAAPNIRLACQCRPKDAVQVTPLVLPHLNPEEMLHKSAVNCEERDVLAMFVDLRGSTDLAERKLPYDILFILNLFMSEMSEAIAESNGHYAHFAGDGIMALYGLKDGIEKGCRDAMRAAVDMQKRLDQINKTLASELDEPLKMGIGLHCGEAIVGLMGPPTSPNTTAIGDNINTAARLEAHAGKNKCGLVLSQDVARLAKCDLSKFPTESARLKGKKKSINVILVEHILDMEACINKG